jgi:hypothetical protein
LVLAFVSLGPLASPALALPNTPVLAGTHPASPGLSTTPRVFGRVSEVITSVHGPGGLHPAGLGGGEEGQVSIYAQAGCAGPEVATGSAAEFENSGIPVTVAPGSTTTFSATNTDVTGVSACSNPIAYRQVSDPPNAPSISGVNPASPADNNLPHITGSAEAGSTVAVYADPACAGAVVGSGSADEFAAGGIQVAVADNSTTTFYARASWAELPSACSSTSVTYEEVTDLTSPPVSPPASPPSTGAGEGPVVGPAKPVTPKIHAVPGGRANNSTPLIAGSAAGATRVDLFKNSICAGAPVVSGTAAQLASGFAVPVAENAVTRFYAQAADARGKESDCSDQELYTEDSMPPQTRVTLGPGARTAKRVIVFRFADVSGDPPGATFACKLDRRPWQVCQAPLRLSHLRPKAHVLRIKATDAAGNQEAVGTRRRFKVIRARH